MLAFSANAWGGWSAPTGISIVDPSAPVARSLDVAVATDGTATAVWVEDNGLGYDLRAARIAPSGAASALPAPLATAASGPRHLQVAVGPDGAATVVWEQNDGEGVVQMSRISPDGTAGLPEDLSSEDVDATTPHLAVGPSGAAIVVWRELSGGGNPVVEMIHVDPGGTPGSAQDLSEGDEDASNPRVAIGSDGTAAVLWHAVGVGLQSVQVDPAGAVGTIRDAVDDADGAIYPPALAIGPDGTATAVWQRAEDDTVAIKTVQLDPDGIAGTVRAVGSPHYLAAASLGHHPEVVVGPDGTATTVWSERELDSPYIVRTARVAPDGTPAAAQTLSPSGDRNALDADLTVGPDGAVTAIWYGYYADDGISTIEARRIAANGSIGAIDSLAFTQSPEGVLDLSSPTIAASADSKVTALWQSSIAIRASRFTEPVPVIPPPKPPPPTVAPPVTKPPPSKPRPSFSLGAQKRKLTVKHGGTARFKTSVRNTGGALAKSVRICAKASKRVRRALLMRKCLVVGQLAAKRLARRTFSVKPRRAAKRGSAYAFKLTVTGVGASPKSIAVRIVVR